MKISHFKANFYDAIDYRYRYLVGFFKDRVTITKYRDGKRLAQFEFFEDKSFIRVKNHSKFKVTLNPTFLLGTLEYWKDLKKETNNKLPEIKKEPIN